MKKGNKITVVTIILTITLIILISIFGLYVKDEYRMKNILPEYNKGMEFGKTILLQYEVDNSIEKQVYDKEGHLVTTEIEEGKEAEYTTVEVPANTQENLTEENYKKTKNVLEKRLDALDINQYNIRLNEETGKLSLEIAKSLENEEKLQYLFEKGGFSVVDSETEEVLISNNMVEKASVVYSSEITETVVYVQVELNEEGKNKLKEISQTYVKLQNQTNDTDEQEKKVNVFVSDSNYFGEAFAFEQVMETGILYLPVGASSNQEEIEEYTKKAEGLKIILGKDSLPIKYSVSTEVVKPVIDKGVISAGLYVALAIITIMIAFFIIKFKAFGLLGALLEGGFVAILLLLVRYTNVVLTIEGFAGIILVSIINYVATYKLLKTYKTNGSETSKTTESLKQIIFTIIPLLLVSIVFIFINGANIASFGMALLWGTLLIGVYNVTITNTILKLI